MGITKWDSMKCKHAINEFKNSHQICATCTGIPSTCILFYQKVLRVNDIQLIYTSITSIEEPEYIVSNYNVF